MKKLVFILIAFVFFVSCEKKVEKGLHKVHWDRDMCELCKMVVSERKYAVQVVNPNTGKSYMFDDLGCTILWFKEEQISWEKDANIFIADALSGDFIDARKAFYDTNSRTPMDYGFGAYLKKEDIKDQSKIIDFTETKMRILRGETMQNAILKKGNQ